MWVKGGSLQAGAGLLAISWPTDMAVSPHCVRRIAFLDWRHQKRNNMFSFSKNQLHVLALENL
jgi:hypothetical protein